MARSLVLVAALSAVLSPVLALPTAQGSVGAASCSPLELVICELVQQPYM